MGLLYLLNYIYVCQPGISCLYFMIARSEDDGTLCRNDALVVAPTVRLLRHVPLFPGSQRPSPTTRPRVSPQLYR